MEGNILTFKTVRAQAGWIPARQALTTILILNAVLVIVCCVFDSKDTALNTPVTPISYLVACALVVSLIWKWGSRQKKFQVAMLKDMIASQKKFLSIYRENDEGTKWRHKRISDSRKLLCQITLGFDYPNTMEEAKLLVIQDLNETMLRDSSLRLMVGTKHWTYAEILTEVTSETDLGKEYIKGFIDGVDRMIDS
jgi:hypothetical protein